MIDQKQQANEQEYQALLKAKYFPPVMSVQHFVNPGPLVQAVSCTQKHKKSYLDL